MARTSVSLRRSTRARQPPTSTYDEELQRLATKKNSQDSDSEDSDVEKEVKEAMDEEDHERGDELSDMDEGDSDDAEEDFRSKAAKTVTPPRKSIAAPTRKSIKRVIQVKASGTTAAPVGKNKTTANKRSIQSALQALSKKVLDSSETPETSLVAALLACYKPMPHLESYTSSSSRTTDYACHKASLYTPQLQAIARKVMEPQDANGMHIQLLNLLFRSVGGNIETTLKEDVDLEDMDDNEWDTLVTNVVRVMRDAPADAELLTAVPNETKLGPREYRFIYREFWYRLGQVLLSHTPGTSTCFGGGDDDEEGLSPKESSPATTTFTSNRFQVELVRELVSRVTELVLVGQPDLRAAATIAVFELAKASMERTVELAAKLETAQRQYDASQKGQSRKKQALQQSMDSWKRHKAELEVVVEEAVIQGVFIRRYRDSNAYIRAESLDTLRQLILLRPDLFLKDKYLKYLGWMTSDKEPIVRLASLQGLLAPFKSKHDRRRPTSLQLDLSNMQNVCIKFLPRIADCTDDSQSLAVQEVAMELIVHLMKNGFLDDWDDDAGWDQLNLKAMDTQATANVRKNALYLILDQLDCFDEGTGADDDTTSRSVAKVVTLSERQQIVRLDAIARWIAHLLTNGTATRDTIKVELADNIVESLREMPEHKSLTTSWNAILKAIKSETSQPTGVRTEKQEAAKTAVLLRILACAARLEVGDLRTKEDVCQKRKRDSDISNQSNEALSQALLKSLPGLLTSFKTDRMSMRSLTKLPQYLLPEIYSLPTRKADFSSLVKNLCVAYLDSSDEEILHEIAMSLGSFVQNDHARVADVKSQLRRVVSAMQDGLMDLFAESDPESNSTPKKNKRKSLRKQQRSSGRRSEASINSGSMSSEALFSNSQEADIEHSICLHLSRWKILLHHIPLSLLFETSADYDDENEVEGFCRTISEALGKRLMDRKPAIEAEGDDAQTDGTRSAAIGSVWKADDTAIHAAVAKSIDLGLDVLLSVVAWNLHDMMEKQKENAQLGVVDEHDDNVHAEELLVVRLRDGLAKLIGLCYDQYLEDLPGVVYSDEQEEFSASVHVSAGRVASDLRSLFPREWILAKDPTLRALALTEDFHLIGGFVRFLQSRENDFVAADDDTKEATALAKELLVPVARALVANWTHGNRKEAGILLSHMTGSGKPAAQTVQAMARLMKKIHPVRFLESQMVSLRMAFKAWLDGEPEEPPSDRPTEEELQQYEQAIAKHDELLHRAEHLASRLSMTLGVGKLNDARLSQALVNFVQEGIRYAFEGDSNEQDDLVLGSRLPFLRVLAKYASWIKKTKSHREILADFLISKEAALRTHPEYDEVHEDDLRCIVDFQDAFGLTLPKRRSVSDRDSKGDANMSRASGGTPGSGAASSRGSRRALSATSSHRSRLSVQSGNLSPLIESPREREQEGRDENDDSSSDSSVSPQKRRRLAASLPELSESYIAEESSDSGESAF